MSTVRWRLAEFLQDRNLSAYALGKAIGTARMNTIYRIARKEDKPLRVEFSVLASVIDGLRKLTGEEVQITDILEYVPDASDQ